MEPHFSDFSLNLDFQDSENETPNKRIIKITDEELEKNIDPLFFSRFTRHMTRTPELTDHGNRKNNAGFLHEFGYGNYLIAPSLVRLGSI